MHQIFLVVAIVAASWAQETTGDNELKGVAFMVITDLITAAMDTDVTTVDITVLTITDMDTTATVTDSDTVMENNLPKNLRSF